MVIPFTPINVIIVLGACFGSAFFIVKLCDGFYNKKQNLWEDKKQ